MPNFACIVLRLWDGDGHRDAQWLQQANGPQVV